MAGYFICEAIIDDIAGRCGWMTIFASTLELVIEGCKNPPELYATRKDCNLAICTDRCQHTNIHSYQRLSVIIIINIHNIMIFLLLFVDLALNMSICPPLSRLGKPSEEIRELNMCTRENAVTPWGQPMEYYNVTR